MVWAFNAWHHDGFICQRATTALKVVRKIISPIARSPIHRDRVAGDGLCQTLLVPLAWTMNLELLANSTDGHLGRPCRTRHTRGGKSLACQQPFTLAFGKTAVNRADAPQMVMDALPNVDLCHQHIRTQQVKTHRKAITDMVFPPSAKRHRDDGDAVGFRDARHTVCNG